MAQASTGWLERAHGEPLAERTDAAPAQATRSRGQSPAAALRQRRRTKGIDAEAANTLPKHMHLEKARHMVRRCHVGAGNTMTVRPIASAKRQATAQGMRAAHNANNAKRSPAAETDRSRSEQPEARRTAGNGS